MGFRLSHKKTGRYCSNRIGRARGFSALLVVMVALPLLLLPLLSSSEVAGEAGLTATEDLGSGAYFSLSSRSVHTREGLTLSSPPGLLVSLPTVQRAKFIVSLKSGDLELRAYNLSFNGVPALELGVVFSSTSALSPFLGSGVSFPLALPKGFSIHKQLPLTQELNSSKYYFINETLALGRIENVSRPEEIVNSFAVLDAQNNKVLHIYRVYLEDSTGRRLWCDTDYKNGALLVSIPPGASSLQFPVFLDPILGVDTVGGSESSAPNSSYNMGGGYTASTTGVITNLHFYTKASTGGYSLRGAVYNGTLADVQSQAGTPSDAVSFTTSYAWYNFTLGSSVSISSGSVYWFCFTPHTSAGGLYMKYDTVAGYSSFSVIAGADTFPNPYSGESVVGSRKVSCYANYSKTYVTLQIGQGGSFYVDGVVKSNSTIELDPGVSYGLYALNSSGYKYINMTWEASSSTATNATYTAPLTNDTISVYFLAYLYSYTFMGSYDDDGSGASADKLILTLYKSNGETENLTIQGSVGTPETEVHYGDSLLTMLSWNISSDLSRVRTYFLDPEDSGGTFQLFTPDSLASSDFYSFWVTDFAGTTNALLEFRVLSGGTYHTITQTELTSLNEVGFWLQWAVSYQIRVVADQGTLTLGTFTALAVTSQNLLITRDAFSNSVIGGLNVTASASRTNSTAISLSYQNTNSNETTAWVYWEVKHRSTMYSSSYTIDTYENFTVSPESISEVWNSAGATTNYLVTVMESREGALYNYTFSCPAPVSPTNPFSSLDNLAEEGSLPIEPRYFIGFFVVVGVGLLFSYFHVVAGMFSVVITATFLNLFGWLDLAWSLLGAGAVLAFLVAIQLWRKGELR